MFDERKARRVTGFIECLRHTKGEFHGKPFKLLPWQEKIIRDVFGTVRDDDPTMRQYTTAYIEIPKKQGKSELGAAIALNMLANDNEWKAEVYSCASDRQQAAIVFDVAVDMVKQSPALSKRIKIIPSMKRMVYQPTGSIYQVLSSEVATKHGLNVSACIFDELHTQPTRALYDVMTQGSGDARKQPLWFFLTTAGTDRNSICWEVHQKALDVLEGRKIDPRFYPVIFGLPDDEDWTSEANWYKANPSLGHTITIDKVRDISIICPIGVPLGGSGKHAFASTILPLTWKSETSENSRTTLLSSSASFSIVRRTTCLPLLCVQVSSSTYVS